MRKLVIKGNNFLGQVNNIRNACRGVVIQDNKILTSYVSKDNFYCLPGGGLEKDEEKIDCCIREVKEETGYIVEVKKHLLEIEEYYEDTLYITDYYECNVLDKGDTNLTIEEKNIGLVPRWINIEELKDIFSRFNERKIETIKGLYLREYTAIKNIDL